MVTSGLIESQGSLRNGAYFVGSGLVGLIAGSQYLSRTVFVYVRRDICLESKQGLSARHQGSSQFHVTD